MGKKIIGLAVAVVLAYCVGQSVFKTMEAERAKKAREAAAKQK